MGKYWRVSYLLGITALIMIYVDFVWPSLVIGFVGANQWLRERRNHQLRTLEKGAGVFWGRLRPAFDDYIGYEMPTKALRQFVEGASWPDEPENEGAKKLRAFAAKVYPPKGGGSRDIALSGTDYDKARIAIRDTLLSWGSRIIGPELSCLIARLDSKNQKETVQLYWFLDEALAKRQGNEDPDFKHLARVRDRMRVPHHYP